MLIAGPEPTTDFFMRHSFPRDTIGTRTLWCAPTREHGQCEVEAAPEKVDRTALAEKVRAVALQDGFGLHQDAPEALGVDGVVGGMYLVFITANGMANFAG